jgi:putative transposase
MDHGRFHATVRGCWVHKIANVLDKLPKSLQPKAKAALHEMMNAPTKVECEKLVAAFVAEHEAKYPKATKALATESDKLMTHFELPAEHWKHLRTTDESQLWTPVALVA